MLTPVLRILAVAAVIGALVVVARKGPGPEAPHQERTATAPGDARSGYGVSGYGVSEPEDSGLRAAEGAGGESAPEPSPKTEKPPGTSEPPRVEEKSAEAASSASKPDETPAPTAERQSAEEKPTTAKLARKPAKPPAPADKPNLLPGEQAEAERQAKLNAPIPPSPPKPKRLFQVQVEDAGTLKSGDMLIRLDGVDTREPTARCKFESGADWPCGAVARAALARLIRGRSIECVLDEDAKRTDTVTRCSVGKTDLSEWLVRQGWASPAKGADKAMAEAHDRAKSERLGFWQKSSPTDASLR